MPTLASIYIYPIKALDGQRVERATLVAGGALEHDRRWAIVDREGDFIHGKRTPLVHRLRSQVDLDASRLTLGVDGANPRQFELAGDRRELSAWLSDYFGTQVGLIENADGGFPDDTESPGPTLISFATLATVADWFRLPVDEVRRRFRANLEIDGVEPFWEDRLVAPGLASVRFRFRDAELLGTNPCQRCVVPSRDAQSGEPLREFARRFAGQRQAALPDWAPRDRFDHFYRLAVNTRAPGARSSTLAAGESLEILGIA